MKYNVLFKKNEENKEKKIRRRRKKNYLFNTFHNVGVI